MKKLLICDDGAYTTADLNQAIADVQRIRDNYREAKHTLDVLQVIERREELAAANSFLGEVGADVTGYKLQTEQAHRRALLAATEKWEHEFNTTDNPDTKKKWTSVDNRARYKAELECDDLLRDVGIAKRTYNHVYFLYAKTIPDLLNAMSSRIQFLLKLMPVGTPMGQMEIDEAEKTLPMPSRWRKGEDDEFTLFDAARHQEEDDYLDDDEPETI